MHQSEGQFHRFADEDNAARSVDISAMAETLASDLKQRAESLLSTLLAEESGIGAARLREHILSRELNVPSVEVYDTVPAIRQALDAVGYHDTALRVYPDEALILIRLPPQMKFWDKRDSLLISWGNHYNALINELWNTARNFVSDRKMVLARLNPPGVHTKEYYYLWLLFPDTHRNYRRTPDVLIDEPMYNE